MSAPARGYDKVSAGDPQAGVTSRAYGATVTTAPGRRGQRSLLSDILGTDALSVLPRDGQILMACRSLRMFAYGFLAVILALYLASLGFSNTQIGQIFTLTLLGDAAISLFMTSRADYFGRRFMLKVGAVLQLATGFVFALSSNFWVLVVAGTFGVISPSGYEVGPFIAIEQSSLTQVIPEEHRTRLFAWYNLFGSLQSAMGGLVCGLAVTWLTDGPPGLTTLEAYRTVMMAYSFIGFLMFFLFLFLTDAVEVSQAKIKELPVTQFLGLHRSKGIVIRMSLLFMLDSFGGGFVIMSFISRWFDMTYQTPAAVLGTIVFICNIVAGISSLFAAKLADMIGLIMTMVVTHLPSNILLILVPLMPNELLSIIVLCARFSISQMDVPTRNSFVMAMVDENERSAAGGVTNIVRSIGASTAPYIAGVLYNNPKTKNVPFFIAGSIKALYDVLLLVAFASVKTSGHDAYPRVSENAPLRDK